MIIFPAIDLYDKKAVRLFKGDYDKMTIYSENPIEVAKSFRTCGAEYIHIVDLEGAKSGETPNFDIVAQIAKESGLSYVQFLRRFKNFCGLTPSEYINELRVQKAKKLLTDTNMLVKDIAYSCGFENEYYFSNFFKKHTAMSPTAFRSLSS